MNRAAGPPGLLSDANHAEAEGCAARLTSSTPAKDQAKQVHFSCTPTSSLPHRRQQRKSTKFSAAFKSPVRTDVAAPSLAGEAASSAASPAADLLQLQAKEGHLDQQIKLLQDDGYMEEELDIHIQKMHEYNEIKDVGQMLIGQIAVQKGVTTRSLYGDFALELDD